MDMTHVTIFKFDIKNVRFSRKNSENVAAMYIAKCSSIVHEISCFSCNQDQSIFKNSGNVEVLLNSY